MGQIKEVEGHPQQQARLVTQLLNILLRCVLCSEVCGQVEWCWTTQCFFCFLRSSSTQLTPSAANVVAKLFDLAKRGASPRDAFLPNTIAHVALLAEQRVREADGATLARLSHHISL